MTDRTEYARDGALSGQCLCGAVRVAIDGRHVAAVGACHCFMCQIWTGGLFATFDAAEEAVTVTGEVTRYASSEFSERAFCPTCGSNLWMRNRGGGANYEFMAGLFRDAARFPLVSEIYVDQAPDYLRLSGDHRRRTAAEYQAGNRSVDGGAP